MHRLGEDASVYSDPWIEQEEAAALRSIPPAIRPPPYRLAPQPEPSKSILTERQKNVVWETLFGEAAPMAQTVFDVARSEPGKKVVSLGGLALGAMLLPLVGGLRR